MSAKPTILIVGTLDTKLPEILYLRSAILSHGTCKTKVLDVSRTQEVTVNSLAILKDEIISPLTEHAEELKSLSRHDYIEKALVTCKPAVKQLVRDEKIQAIVSAAGNTGLTIATAIMRDTCPLGFPKLVVTSEIGSDVRPYIAESDIMLMQSVVHIAGLNSVLEQTLSNAAGAISGMAVAFAEFSRERKPSGKHIALTTVDLTAGCVEHIRKILTSSPHDNSGYELYVFRATGAGGKVLEELIKEGKIDAVIDLTTAEISNELFGGALSAGPDRLDAAVKKGIPMVVSTGGCDTVTFASKDAIPDRYRDRKLHTMSPSATLMRTSKENCHQIGKFIASKLKVAEDPSKIRVLLPTGGISMLDKDEAVFHDTEADKELFQAIVEDLKDTKIEIFQYPEHINDEAFAAQLCEHLMEAMGIDPRTYRLANARRRKWSFDHGRSIAAIRRASQVEIPHA